MELKFKEPELRCGLECHQQLDTCKLFCSCPSVLRTDNPDYIIERELHAVAGETGEIDEAVKFESSRDRKFSYQCYYDNNCLIEIDESPPEEINQEALKIALQIALLLNCEIIQDTQIMRKTVIDGSNTSGFQRSVLIARNGYIETSQGKVGIQSICLEEDAARIVVQEKDRVIYRLDRLGIPLVEIATMPDIHSASQAKETALLLGEILRACKVKRGLGTIRQDVNLSVSVNNKSSERVEIKGFQDIKTIEKTIELEMKRQIDLVKKGKSSSEVRKAEEDGTTGFLRPMPGGARMYPETDLPLLHISRDMINLAKSELPKLRSEIKDKLRKHGLNEELVKLLAENKMLDEFSELIQVYNKPDLIAKILTIWISDLASKEKKSREEIEEKLTIDIIETILQAVSSSKIQESEIYDVMREIIQGKDVKKALIREKVNNIEEEILRLIKEKPGLNLNAYMGLVLGKFKGKVNAKEVSEILKKLIK